MNTAIKRTVFFSIATCYMAIMFQNCSGVAGAPVESAVTSSVTGTDSMASTDPGVTTVGTQPNPPSVTNPPSNPPTNPPAPPTTTMTPPTTTPPTDSKPPVDTKKPPVTLPPVVVGGSCDDDKHPGSTSSHDDDMDDSDDVTSLTDKDLQKFCEEQQNQKVLQNPLNIADFRGYTIASIKSTDKASNLRGKTVLIGATPDAKIKEISNVRGDLIVCGLQVGDIVDTRGKLYLVNSKVDSLDDHRGNIRLVNSTITLIGNVRGNVVH